MDSPPPPLSSSLSHQHGQIVRVINLSVKREELQAVWVSANLVLDGWPTKGMFCVVQLCVFASISVLYTWTETTSVASSPHHRGTSCLFACSLTGKLALLQHGLLTKSDRWFQISIGAVSSSVRFHLGILGLWGQLHVCLFFNYGSCIKACDKVTKDAWLGDRWRFHVCLFIGSFCASRKAFGNVKVPMGWQKYLLC